jgi:hypothetical protein
LIEQVGLVNPELLVRGDYADHGEKISDHRALNLQIERTVSVEGRGKIDLQQPGSKVVVQQDIKAEYFEAVGSVGHIHL